MSTTRIALADMFFPLVNSGAKTTTIRYKHREYPLGDAVFYSDTSEQTTDICIDGAKYKTFGELTDMDAITDGFCNITELRKELRGFYPECQDADEITKVIFHKR